MQEELWVVTETRMNSFKPFDHQLGIWIFTSEQKAQDYLKLLMNIAKGESDEGDVSNDEDNEISKYCIKKHIINPTIENICEIHYDRDVLDD